MASEKSATWTRQQQLFIQWLALPKAERKPKTYQLFAKEIGVHPDTLTDWKKKPGFMDSVNALAKEFVKEDVAEVLSTIRRKAKKGDLPYVNMVLSMAGMAGDIEKAGKGPAEGVTIREVVVERIIRD